MLYMKTIAPLASVLCVLFTIVTGALAEEPGKSESGYVSLTAGEFAAKAADLLNKDVEVSGDIQPARMMSPKSVGTMVDTATGKVLVQLTAKPGTAALNYLVGGSPGKFQGVYARGKVVMAPGGKEPVLDLADISKESKVQTAAAKKEERETIAAKDKEGLAKSVLPPHTNPSGEAAKAWLDRIPQSSPSYNRAKSVWDNMQSQSKWRMQADADDRQAIIRGPDRPANFETYYRGLRDTGLADIFAKAPYRDSSTSWPRVMIVIEEKPQLQGGMPSEFFRHGTKTETDYTWRFRAVVWPDATHRIDIEPFNWCFSEMRYNTPYSEVVIWGRTPKLNVPPPAGLTAAPGDPKAPAPTATKLPLPDTPAYHRTFHYNTIMVGNLLLDMGFDYHRRDGRVWFVEDIAK